MQIKLFSPFSKDRLISLFCLISIIKYTKTIIDTHFQLKKSLYYIELGMKNLEVNITSLLDVI